MFLKDLLYILLLLTVLIHSINIHINSVYLINLIRSNDLHLINFSYHFFKHFWSYQIIYSICEQKLFVISLGKTLQSACPINIWWQIGYVYFELASNGSFNGPTCVKPETNSHFKIWNWVLKILALIIFLYLWLNLQSHYYF